MRGEVHMTKKGISVESRRALSIIGGCLPQDMEENVDTGEPNSSVSSVEDVALSPDPSEVLALEREPVRTVS